MAFAQSDMRLDVPFAFSTPHMQMPAGKYYISEVGGNRSVPFYRVQHAETGKSTVIVSPGTVTRKGVAYRLNAQVDFRCIDEQCALATIYPVGSQVGRTIPVKSKSGAKGSQVATLSLAAATD
jgi:hypothetical protein